MLYDMSLLRSVGEDVYISSNVEIRRPHLVSVGSHIAIDSGFYITTQAQLEDYIHIAPYVTVIGGVNGLLKMGNFTNISVGGKIICGSDEFLGAGLVTAPGIPDEFRDTLVVEPVVFEDFANVGANVVIMPGVTLAEGSVVGACSLVTKTTEPWTIYIGTPAKPVKARSKDKMIEHAKKLGYR
ncbi:acyltransferase [Pantanalinema rosaneae CENA516]|uniref:acyltransferase n=1 Tax=Pantanalinema rosaneae TaxID=1620701 RepID=UPI003D6DD830